MLKKIKDWIGSNLDVYKVESASDVGAGLYRHVWKGRENATQIGTTLNAEIMNNLQNSLVHSINATKTTGTGTDYYICNLDGLTEFGLNNDLKLRITVDNTNTNTTTKLRLNNNDYTLLKEQNGTLKQIEARDIHSNKTYELIYNGSQFVIINLFKNFESAYLDNYVKTTDLAQENKAGIVTLNKIKGLIPTATNDTNGTINLRQINDMIDTKVPNASNNTNGTVNLRQINDMIDIRVPGATNNIAGKVMLGTTRNTALEGSRLGEILGLEFGGNIQDSGSKIKGKFYYDSVTKFYYECLENTNLTYNDSGKFRAISNKPISDKVENLFEIHHIEIGNNIEIGKIFETNIKYPSSKPKILYSVHTGNDMPVDLKSGSKYSVSEIAVNLGVSKAGNLQYSVAKNTQPVDGRFIEVMFVF